MGALIALILYTDIDFCNTKLIIVDQQSLTSLGSSWLGSVFRAKLLEFELDVFGAVKGQLTSVIKPTKSIH